MYLKFGFKHSMFKRPMRNPDGYAEILVEVKRHEFIVVSLVLKVCLAVVRYDQSQCGAERVTQMGYFHTSIFFC